jgi:thymidylate kinase
LTSAPRWLREFERSAYALVHRFPPDLVVKLEVGAETAVRREPDMDPALIRQRIAHLRRLTFASPRVASIDAERPLKDVIRAVKREIWHLL